MGILPCQSTYGFDCKRTPMVSFLIIHRIELKLSEPLLELSIGCDESASDIPIHEELSVKFFLLL